jgi:hypothetical protein
MSRGPRYASLRKQISDAKAIPPPDAPIPALIGHFAELKFVIKGINERANAPRHGDIDDRAGEEEHKEFQDVSASQFHLALTPALSRFLESAGEGD